MHMLALLSAAVFTFTHHLSFQEYFIFHDLEILIEIKEWSDEGSKACSKCPLFQAVYELFQTPQWFSFMYG